MSNVTQQYLFRGTDTNPFVFNGGNAYVFGNMSWDKRNYGSHASWPPANQLMGALWVQNRMGASQTDCYWELTKTFAELGVPAGNIPYSINVEYLYRFKVQRCKNCSRLNSLVLSKGDARVGPVAIHNGAGTLLGYVGNIIPCPARSGVSDWIGSPAGGNAQPFPNVAGGDYKPQSWGESLGMALPLSGLTQNSTIKVRLNLRMPACPFYGQDEPSKNFIVKMDYVRVTVEYGLPPATTQGLSQVTGISTITF